MGFVQVVSRNKTEKQIWGKTVVANTCLKKLMFFSVLDVLELKYHLFVVLSLKNVN